MGYEKGITARWRDMVLHGEYPDRIPGGPRSPDSPAGGTPNHELLARMARLTWALEKGTPEQQEEELAGVVRFYDNQIANGFMTRGQANEQLSPSHSQWWITAALGLRWVAWERKEQFPEASRQLMWVTGRWLRHHHALCRLFATPDGIVVPGARAWPGEGGDGFYGKSKVRDELYKAIESGKVRKLWDPERNLDMLGLVFADKLLKAGDDLGGAKGATELPKLRWPISVRRNGNNFTAWLTSIDNTLGLRVQRLARWQDGKESYGFDDAVEDAWEGIDPKVIGLRWERGDGDGAGLSGLIAEMREVAERRPASRAELNALAGRLEGLGEPEAPEAAEIVAGLRALAERRPAARADLLSFAERLERLRQRPERPGRPVV